MKNFMQSQSTKERIELLEKQISVVTRSMQQSKTNDERERYSRMLQRV
jgi:hypothetical protein